MTPCNCHQHGGNVSGDDASGQTLVMKQFETSANPEQRAQPVHVPDGSNVRRIGGELFIVEEAAHEKAEHTGSSNTSRDNGEQPEQCGVVCHELASIFGAFVASVIDKCDLIVTRASFNTRKKTIRATREMTICSTWEWRPERLFLVVVVVLQTPTHASVRKERVD
jgi:hypothetical protein